MGAFIVLCGDLLHDKVTQLALGVAWLLGKGTTFGGRKWDRIGRRGLRRLLRIDTGGNSGSVIHRGGPVKTEFGKEGVAPGL